MHPKIINYISNVRAQFIKRKIDNTNAKVLFVSPNYQIKITKAKNAKFIVNGQLTLKSFPKETAATSIVLEENALLEINGVFQLGNGVTIYVGKNGVCKITGKGFEKKGSITADTMIIVYKRVEIGTEFNCGWGCYITDCDWHQIEHNNQPTSFQKDVIIGDHVWITHDCSILKGTTIGNGCTIGCKSVLQNKSYPENTFITGIPAKVIRTNSVWKR